MKTSNDTFRDKFMGYEPRLLSTIINELGQTCEFFEHPLERKYAKTIYILINGVLGDTEHYDTMDFYEGSAYMPVLIGSTIMSQYESGDMSNNPSHLLIEQAY